MSNRTIKTVVSDAINDPIFRKTENCCSEFLTEHYVLEKRVA